MAHIFLSYARGDRDVARRLADALTAEGWPVWWDREIAAGRDFRTTIEQALHAADCILVLWSRSSLSSQFVIDEADEGRRRGVLLPVSIDGSSPPLGFRQLQTAKLDRADDFTPVIRDIPRLCPRPERPPTPSQPSEPPSRSPLAGAGDWHVRPVLGGMGLLGALCGWLYVSAPVAGPQANRDEIAPSRTQVRLPPAGPIPPRASVDARPPEPPPPPQPPQRPPLPRASFQDCGACPRMIRVHASPFWMGAEPGAPLQPLQERPRHRVALVHPFAISESRVTRAQWQACVQANACPPLGGSADAEQAAATRIPWPQAAAYARWLSSTTGKKYQLPSEAEWEFVARMAMSGLPQTWSTAPRDLLGHGWEWVQDCWNETYEGEDKPADGSAWETGNCDRRVVRGGGRSPNAASLRATRRDWRAARQRSDDLGFRVVRVQQ